MRVYERPNTEGLDTIEKIDVSDDSESDSESDSEDSDSDAESEYSSTTEAEIMENTRIISMNNLEEEQFNANAETGDVIALNVIKPLENDTALIKKEIETELEADLEALTISDLSNGDDEEDEGEDEGEEDEEVELNTTETTTSVTLDVDVNYRKMKVSELRTIVKNKGLSEDTKKMKKTELLQLLSA